MDPPPSSHPFNFTTNDISVCADERRSDRESDSSPHPPPCRLNVDELDALKRAVGSTASLLSSALCKLYLCPAGSRSYSWSGVWGACILVVDRANSNPSKHLQIYNLHASGQTNAIAAAASPDASPTAMTAALSPLDRLLNVQLYEGMEYAELDPLFHTFEADNVMIGFSFGNAADAAELFTKVREHIPAVGSAPRVAVRKASLLQRISGIFSSSPSAAAGVSTTPTAGGYTCSPSPTAGSSSPMLSPAISPPQGFVHHAHAGFSPEGVFVPRGDLPVEWHGLFENALAQNKLARERSSNSSQNNSTTPAAHTNLAGGLQGSPHSAHSEGSPSPFQQAAAHHRQTSQQQAQGAWIPTQSPAHSPK